MKVLASYPGGLASVADLTRDLKVLAASGSDWAERTKRMGFPFNELDIFGAGFVDRYSFGWRLTAKGLAALQAMERMGYHTSDRKPTAMAADQSPTEVVTSTASKQKLPQVRRPRFAVIEGGRSNHPVELLPTGTARARN